MKESNPNYDRMCIYGDYFGIVKKAEGEDAVVEVRSHIDETFSIYSSEKNLSDTEAFKEENFISNLYRGDYEGFLAFFSYIE